MSDSGNIHVGDVETVVDATTPSEEQAAPAPAASDEDGVRRAVERMRRDRRRTRAWGFDD